MRNDQDPSANVRKPTVPEFDWFWTRLNAFLQNQDLKQTKQRKVIIEYFLRCDRHIDAEMLYEDVRGDGHKIGLATIYRTLNLLKSAGLVEQHAFADGRAVFEITNPDHHHDHLICVRCGEVKEFLNEKIEKLQHEIATAHGYTLTNHRMELFGSCPKCQ